MKSTLQKIAYEQELKKVARRLGLTLRGNLEEAVLDYCKKQIEQWVAAHSQPKTLTELLALVATSLGIVFEEIHNTNDLEALLVRIPPQQEPIMARLNTEFDDKTDAVTIRRDHRESWEQPFLAVINCQGWHGFRRYFSKWHEAAHRLIAGQQLQFAFRRTPIPELRREPQEILVDKIAATLAFYSGIFEPVFREEFERSSRLTFKMIDDIRLKVAPDASRHATILACLSYCPHPAWFLRCSMALKKGEERQLPQMRLFPDKVQKTIPKLRVREMSSSPAVSNTGIRIHQNMQVPASSIVGQAFRDPTGSLHEGREPLEAWETSSTGPIGYGTLEVEALRIDDEVWALLHLVKHSG